VPGGELIEQIFRPEPAEQFQWTLPVLHNGGGVLTIPNGLQNLTRTNQSQCLVNLEAPAIKPVKRAGDFYSKGGRIQGLSIEEDNLDATTQLILKTTGMNRTP